MANKNNYEDNVLKIEKILEELYESEASLDKSIELFGIGIELINDCNKYLEKAEKKIKILQENAEVDWREDDE